MSVSVACTVDPKQIEALRQGLLTRANRLQREIATAINATARKVRFEASKALKKLLPATVPTGVIKKNIKSKSFAKPAMGQMIAIVRLRKGTPIALRYFGAKDMRPNGVRVHLDRRIKGKAGKTFLPHAFIVNQYGRNVYERVGKESGPIKQQYGPSPGDLFEAANILKLSYQVARAELPKQMKRRIRFLMRQTSGNLRGNSTGRKGRGNQ